MSRLLLATVVLGALASCAPPPRQPLYRATFEDVCDGTPCGWTQVAGPEGAAIFVATIPGEHGVQLVGDGVAIAGPIQGDEVTAATIPASDLQAHIVARCDEGAVISIIVSMQEVSGAAVDMVTSLRPATTWNGDRPVLVLTARDAAEPPFSFTDILAVIIRKEGPGACEVDYFSLGSSAQPFVE